MLVKTLMVFIEEAVYQNQVVIINKATYVVLFLQTTSICLSDHVSLSISSCDSHVIFIALCELHGNSNLERCKKCGREYLRDYSVRYAVGVHDHFTGTYIILEIIGIIINCDKTGKKCDDLECRGPLEDTIVNFGENLPEGINIYNYTH